MKNIYYNYGIYYKKCIWYSQTCLGSDSTEDLKCKTLHKTVMLKKYTRAHLLKYTEEGKNNTTQVAKATITAGGIAPLHDLRPAFLFLLLLLCCCAWHSAPVSPRQKPKVEQAVKHFGTAVQLSGLRAWATPPHASVWRVWGGKGEKNPA